MSTVKLIQIRDAWVNVACIQRFEVVEPRFNWSKTKVKVIMTEGPPYIVSFFSCETAKKCVTQWIREIASL